MWIVKENLVGTQVRVVQRHDNKIQWRGVVRGIGIQEGFKLLVEVTEVLQENGLSGSRWLGELVEVPITSEWIAVVSEVP